MDRRAFMASLAAMGAATTGGLWVPGAKTFFLPPSGGGWQKPFDAADLNFSDLSLCVIDNISIHGPCSIGDIVSVGPSRFRVTGLYTDDPGVFTAELIS